MLKHEDRLFLRLNSGALPDLTQRPAKTLEPHTLAEFQMLPPSVRPFAYIPEEVSANLAVSECHEPFVDLKELFEAAKVPGHFIHEEGTEELYGGPRLLLRTSVALKVLAAAESIMHASDGSLTVMVNSAHRPLELQRKFFEAEWKEQEKLLAPERPGNMSDEEFCLRIWQEVTKYVADPKLNPPHLSGGAVDLTLVYNKRGFPQVDMGTPINEGDARCHTWHFDGLSPAQILARQFFYSHLRSAGLVNLSTEWWHWSDGEGYASVFNGERSARFGSMSAEEALETLVPAAKLLAESNRSRRAPSGENESRPSV